MGREVRRVIPNWEHPKKEYLDRDARKMVESYQPLHDRDFEASMQKWLDELAEWKASKFAETMAEHPDLHYKVDEPYRAFCDWSGTAPDPEYYRPKWDETEATWYQLYETVTEERRYRRLSKHRKSLLNI